MSMQQAVAQPAAQVQPGILDQIIAESRVAQSDQERHRARDIISELVRQVLQGEVVVSENLAASLDARVAELDRLISEQLSEVMHAPEFQALESAWTGLHYLCKQTSTGEMMKIKLLNVGKRELVKDFKTAIDFDQSALFKKVYEEEFGTFGGAPFGALVGQYELNRQAEDMYFIEQMSHIAAAAHAPFVAGLPQQSEVAELDGEEVVVIMGNPAGQLANGLELLCLAQMVFKTALLLFDASAVGKVLDLHQTIIRHAVGAAHQPRREDGVNGAAILAEKPFLQRVTFDLPGEHPVKQPDVLSDIVRVREFKPGQPAQLRFGVAKQFREFLVHGQPLFLGRGDGHAEEGILEVRAEFLFALRQRPGVLLLGTPQLRLGLPLRAFPVDGGVRPRQEKSPYTARHQEQAHPSDPAVAESLDERQRLGFRRRHADGPEGVLQRDRQKIGPLSNRTHAVTANLIKIVNAIARLPAQHPIRHGLDRGERL